MYGTPKTLGQALLAQFPHHESLAVLVWTEADICTLAEEWEQTVTTQEAQAVLEKIGTINPEEQLLEGVSAGTVLTLLEMVKADAREVCVSADLLDRLVRATETSLWALEWKAKDENRPLPAHIVRRQEDVARLRELLKS